MNQLKAQLDHLVDLYNSPDFIQHDPIVIPHQFSIKQDIEISALIAAIFAWGQRKTIINKAHQFLSYMDHDPFQFIVGHKESDRRPFLDFKHRTFQPIDALYMLEFLQQFYRKHNSLEKAFIDKADPGNCKMGIANFHELFFALSNAPTRTRKHIPTPKKGSTCKRLNMFLRWMVRHDDKGVDFGIWRGISPSQLMIPLDVHVERIAREFALLDRKQRDWKAVEELTNSLKRLDPKDPVKYDFALFGLGVLRK